MPRAKRTDRAEARRRYRASLDAERAAAADATDVDEEAAEVQEPRTPSRPAPQPRPGIGAAFRGAFHPLTLREDLQTFPPLLRHRATWVPILLTIAVGLAYLATRGENALILIVATYFIAPPALGPAFIAGFMAPRSSYLIGFVVGLASALVAAALIVALDSPITPGGTGSTTASPTPGAAASPGTSVAISASPAASPVTSPSPAASVAVSPAPTPSPTGEPGQTPIPDSDQIIYALLTSPPFAMVFAAMAAWYRRFLRLSSPNRQRLEQRQRRPDGRRRSSGSTRR